MSRREDVENVIWADPDFAGLSANGKLVYLWSFTNPLCGMAGLYKVALDRIAFDTGLTKRRTEEALGELQQAAFVYYGDGVLWVRSRVKHLRTRTTQMAKSIARDLTQIPADHPLLAAFLHVYGDVSWLKDQIPHEQRESVNLTRTSPEPIVKEQGKGKGKGRDSGSSDVSVLRLPHDGSNVVEFSKVERATNGEAA